MYHQHEEGGGMSFLKLDCNVMESSLWPDFDARNVFFTALLMAVPHYLAEPTPQIAITSLDETGWCVPAGDYGFVAAASTALIHRTGIPLPAGIAALERLGAPELESRSPAYEGRRLVRVAGGFVVLNFSPYRQKDHTTAARSRAYRDRQRRKAAGRKRAAKDTRAVVEALQK